MNRQRNNSRVHRCQKMEERRTSAPPVEEAVGFVVSESFALPPHRMPCSAGLLLKPLSALSVADATAAATRTRTRTRIVSGAGAGAVGATVAGKLFRCGNNDFISPSTPSSSLRSPSLPRHPRRISTPSADFALELGPGASYTVPTFCVRDHVETGRFPGPMAGKPFSIRTPLFSSPSLSPPLSLPPGSLLSSQQRSF